VLRQGDVYFVEQARDNFRDLPRNHRWDAQTRLLNHPEHAPLPYPLPGESRAAEVNFRVPGQPRGGLIFAFFHVPMGKDAFTERSL
jgi:hypothetical protein